MRELVWLIPALPLAGFAVLVVLGRRLGNPLAGWLATLMVAASFAASIVVWLGVRAASGERSSTQRLFTWIPAGGFRVDVAFLVDPLSITMALFVTGISALIHLYSIGYMHADAHFTKFFVYLNLFVFSMLVLVLGDNLLLTFLGWEGVGTCSYLLISFWFEEEANASAGKKAFVTNRIGDWGFMVATLFTFFAIGSVRYADITAAAPGLATSTATVIAVLLFLGAVGKSAQLPLYVWLPDAMAGPTPVSALIHAATMVTAGVYLMTRVGPVLAAASPWVPTLIAVVGGLTALFAATIAVAQTDIKKVLAYSTVSQLGYMFLAIGSGAYVAAVFHMITHAFFKAVLFLGAGSVIHGMHEEQDMRRMGALKRAMPITALTFGAGSLALAGIPPFSGFWSKDEILLGAWNRGGFVGRGLWVIGVLTALMTAFYVGRMVFLTFFGQARWGDAPAHAAGEAERSAVEVDDGARTEHSGQASVATAAPADHGRPADQGALQPHESPWTMTLPLVVLGVAATLGGALNLPVARLRTLASWLDPVVGGQEIATSAATATKWILAAIAVVAALVGLGAAGVLYLRRRFADQPREPRVLARGWYVDEAVTAFAGGPGRRLFDGVAWFDRTVVDGAVNGVGFLVRGAGSGLRRAQSGYVRNYALGFAAGAIVLVAVLVLRGVSL
ncbi:MAG: NADH-quinone oxidoreductase subunit L [Actinobacteria bacterium]|nr:NADH-quinone oxidoreductase subunit L [Actinomycetota bacterium]